MCVYGAGGGHIVFSEDHVGILVNVGVASCLHSVSLINGLILANLHKFIIGWGKMLNRFGDLDPIFKVT